MTKKQTGVFEWAQKGYNILDGCSHGCVYCYACSMAVQYRRMTSGKEWSESTIKSTIPKIPTKPCRVMFPTAHDLDPEHLDLHICTIGRLLNAGHTLLLVSKPHIEVIKAICERFAGKKDKILFRFSIGSADSAVLKAWEPGAPSFEERLECLKYAFKQGFQTSVSAEPMLDNKVGDVIIATLPYITDQIWLGLMKAGRQRLTMNGHGVTHGALYDLLQRSQPVSYIMALYETYKGNEKIAWKDSIMEIVNKNMTRKAS